MSHRKPSSPSRSSRATMPSFRASLIPVVWLLGCIILCIVTMGAGAVVDMGKYVMLSSAAIAILIARWRCHRQWRHVWIGVAKSGKQLIPAMMVLLFIAMVSTMWMLSGVVPTLIDIGLQLLNPRFFLLTTCVICSVVSVFTGSSWTTIATIGVALQGIGTVFGYSDGWIAGAIISGAYFGDKISPLSDTTVLASSTCGVPLFDHVRYMLYSTVPAISIALLTYLAAGWLIDTSAANQSGDMLVALRQTFHITPWTLVIPLLTAVLIGFRININLTLACSTLMGVLGFAYWQQDLLVFVQHDAGMGEGALGTLLTLARTLCVGAEMHTGNALLDELATTGGIRGMWSTFSLVFCSMIFGGVLMGTGMLSAITSTITRRLNSVRRLVSATVGTGIFLNATTADQYLSIILGGNVYRKLYARQRLENRLLSRTIEDSTSVTSVLIPWNSCGLTQSTVLGVATLTYLPYCVFNLLSPCMSLLFAYTGYTIRRTR